ncbi:MAG: hypothetical protein LQ342_007454 [Letrouitia transgressa]|nr:MAG: hypothetical protein LQ342_007454 [Letrouitia transgressa]
MNNDLKDIRDDLKGFGNRLEDGDLIKEMRNDAKETKGATIRHASLAARQTPAELVEPSLDQFLNQTVLDTLKTIPHVGAEWADEVTNTTFLANLKVVDDLGLRGLSPSSNPLQPRFINVGRCHIEHKRLALRQALGNVRSMLRAVESIEKVHPVWQALISARWRDSDDTLKRTKGLFKVLADTIDDQFKKIYLSCNPTLGCLHKRRAPGTEQIQVTIAEYDFDIQTINMCESFFGRALQGGMQCLDNLPIGQYKSPASSELWLIHELFHAVFDELGANE